jgi:hypothetical protein
MLKYNLAETNEHHRDMYAVCIIILRCSLTDICGRPCVLRQDGRLVGIWEESFALHRFVVLAYGREQFDVCLDQALSR